MRMIKRVLPLFLAFLILTMAGCSSGGVAVDTDLGTFQLLRSKLVDRFDTLSATSGKQLLALAFSAGAFDETLFSSHFVGDENKAGARVRVDGKTYPCLAVGYQGNEGEDTVEYVLLFEIAQREKLDNASIELMAPGKSWVTIK